MRKLHTALLSTAALLGGTSVQSATAAELAVKAPPPPAPIVSRWDGLYASFSAGETWTHAKESFVDTGLSTQTSNNFFGGPFGADPNPLTSFSTVNNSFSSSESLTGNETGAVFTFAMGYNVTWSRWLAGIQSEVSLNRNNIRLQGAGQNSSTQTNVFTGLPPFFGAPIQQ